MNVDADELPADGSSDTCDDLRTLEDRINRILPPRYVGCFEDVPPSSMGSATLKYDKDGNVAWGAIWTSFCHLALAGGPPHRGSFLGAVPASEALAHPAEQAAVVAEIKRAIRLIGDLAPIDDAPPGWIGMACDDVDMAAWLVRAIVAENVIARHDGALLYVPAGPRFRVEKEIKNVVVCVAKTCHYLLDHVSTAARPRGLSSQLIQPPLPEEIATDAERFRASTIALRDDLARFGFSTIESESPGWIGVVLATEEMAVWMQRAVVLENILSRRESNTLFVPIVMNEQQVNSRLTTVRTLNKSLRLWQLRSSG